MSQSHKRRWYIDVIAVRFKHIGVCGYAYEEWVVTEKGDAIATALNVLRPHVCSVQHADDLMTETNTEHRYIYVQKYAEPREVIGGTCRVKAKRFTRNDDAGDVIALAYAVQFSFGDDDSFVATLFYRSLDEWCADRVAADDGDHTIQNSLVLPAGLEPASQPSEGCVLSIERRERVERMMGVEPTSQAWEARVLAVVLHPHATEIVHDFTTPLASHTSPSAAKLHAFVSPMMT